MPVQHLEAKVVAALEEHGLLPVQDARVTSVCTLAAGEPVRGSWWGHPQSQVIFELLGSLEDDYAWPKLLWGKVTLVHRRLWPALAAVGEQQASWQTDGLGGPARELLGAVRRVGEVRSDTLGEGSRRLVTELERRLLVVAEEVYTGGARHGGRLRTWEQWLPDTARPAAADARTALERAASSLGARLGLPW